MSDEILQDEQKEVKTEGKPEKVIFTEAQQEEINRLIGNTRKEAREKVRKELEAEQAKLKEETERSALSEQGKYKELAEKAEQERQQALAEAEKSASELKSLRMERLFDEAAAELGILFVSKQAAKDAYKFLNSETVGDGSGMRKAVEALRRERPYLFSEDEGETTTDAKAKGKRQPTKEDDAVYQKEIESRYRIRKPR